MANNFKRTNRKKDIFCRGCQLAAGLPAFTRRTESRVNVWMYFLPTLASEGNIWRLETHWSLDPANTYTGIFVFKWRVTFNQLTVINETSEWQVSEHFLCDGLEQWLLLNYVNLPTGSFQIHNLSCVLLFKYIIVQVNENDACEWFD